MYKEIKDLSFGDLIWMVNSKGEFKKVVKFIEMYETSSRKTGIIIGNIDNDNTQSVFIKGDVEKIVHTVAIDDSLFLSTIRPKDLPDKGIGFYKHLKTGKCYEMISEHFMFKDFEETKIEEGEFAHMIFVKNKENFEWKRDLILYKALYDCPDGTEFARHSIDFYSNFIRIG